MTPPLRSVTILIAEDDDGHAELIQEHLRDAGVSNEMVRFHDGRALLEYLEAAGAAPDAPDGVHFLLLLDLWMPRCDGLGVLQRLKRDERWRAMPVIVLTTTDDPAEIQSCYEQGCNCYLVKPLDYRQFTHVLKQLGLFLMVVEVPSLRSAKTKGGEAS